jgi:hypothetical protein
LASWNWINTVYCFLGLLLDMLTVEVEARHPQDGGSSFLWNVGNPPVNNLCQTRKTTIYNVYVAFQLQKLYLATEFKKICAQFCLEKEKLHRSRNAIKILAQKSVCFSFLKTIPKHCIQQYQITRELYDSLSPLALT